MEVAIVLIVVAIFVFSYLLAQFQEAKEKIILEDNIKNDPERFTKKNYDRFTDVTSYETEYHSLFEEYPYFAQIKFRHGMIESLGAYTIHIRVFAHDSLSLAGSNLYVLAGGERYMFTPTNTHFQAGHGFEDDKFPTLPSGVGAVRTVNTAIFKLSNEEMFRIFSSPKVEIKLSFPGDEIEAMLSEALVKIGYGSHSFFLREFSESGGGK